MAVSAELLALLDIDTSNREDEVLFGDDFLLGTISGGAGDDYVEGKGGLDLLTGGTGSDTVGYSESDVGVHINLGNLLLGLLGAWGGDADGDVLVNGFENVVGSAHADDISGDGGANILVGLEDADRLDGSGGDDTLIGGIGADALIGDAGSDTASYALANAGVAVSLSTGTGTQGEATGDTLTGIENLAGSAFADVLEGSALANRILAGAGGDRIIGTDGLDVIHGGDGDDTLDFSANTAGVEIDFGSGRYTSVEGILGGQGGDTINLAAPQTAGAVALAAAADDTAGASVDGGAGDDNIDGSDNDDDEDGGEGDDTLNGAGGNDDIDGGAGHDTLDGGAGNDTFHYSEGADYAAGGTGGDTYLIGTGHLITPTGVDTLAAATDDEVDAGTFDAGDGANEISFDKEADSDPDPENMVSSGVGPLQDLRGVDVDVDLIAEGETSAAAANQFRAAVSFKTLDSQAHVLNLTWDDPGETLASTDSSAALEPASSMKITGTSHDDTIENKTGFDLILDGRGGNDTLTGGTGSEIFIGGAGADAIAGGDGAPDTADYSGSDAGVTISLPDGTASGGHAEGDTLTDIEGLVGSAFEDTLTGGPVNNSLDGRGGNDRLDGGAGDDHLTGGDGDDTLQGGNGVDVMTGGAGADMFLYTGVVGSLPTARDQITDFSQAEGDRIDLSAIDANPSQAGDQAFRFIGSAQFGGQPGALRAVADNSVEGFNTRIAADVNGDGTADFAVMVNVVGGGALAAGDFVL